MNTKLIVLIAVICFCVTQASRNETEIVNRSLKVCLTFSKLIVEMLKLTEDKYSNLMNMYMEKSAKVQLLTMQLLSTNRTVFDM